MHAFLPRDTRQRDPHDKCNAHKSTMLFILIFRVHLVETGADKNAINIFPFFRFALILLLLLLRRRLRFFFFVR